MLQEDSNGETSFEIIDKKNEASSNNSDKTESISGVSSPYSIPSPSMITSPGGNLLSNLPPPTNLPDFTLWQSQTTAVPTVVTPIPQNPTVPTVIPQPNKTTAPPITGIANVQPSSAHTINQPYPLTQFSAAIPPSKGVQHGPVTQGSFDANQGAGGLIGWMKDAVSSGGILSKVAEKAKNSVDSLITTLDPQMSEFIYSGGDVEIAVTSNNLDEVAPIRDAIYAVFGKAWVNLSGANLNIEGKHQAVGFEEGLKFVELKVDAALQLQKIPTIAIENILLKENNEWFDLSVLFLKDPERQISLHIFTQTTPVPVDVFLKEAEKDMPVYAKECDSTEKLLSAYLISKKSNWQETVCGVSKKDILYLAAKALVSIYKSKLSINQ